MNVLIMCNPYSGKGKNLIFARKLLDRIVSIDGATAEIFVSKSIDSLHEFFNDLSKTSPNKFDCAIFLGGDGTFGIAVDAMLKAGLDFPVAIFPLGTVNDFAKQLKMNCNVEKCVDLIFSNKIKRCDVAMVNGDYVVNVACGGYFTHGANTYSRKAKKLFGRMAYYGKGIFNIFNMHPQYLRFTVDDKIIEEHVVMYLILNSASAGGFKHIGADAQIDDGFFDLCIIKKPKPFTLLSTVFKIFSGKHKNDKNIVYAKGKNFKVELLGDKINPKFLHSDTDGNVGACLPLEITVLNKHLNIFYNN